MRALQPGRNGLQPRRVSSFSALLAAGGLALALLVVLVPVGVSGAATRPVSHPHPSCTSTHVLLLGSYPSEVSANLQQEVLAPNQPTVINGVDFYVGTLDGHHVVIAIAGPSPADTQAITVSGLEHFRCTSAVVFSGTAGGGGATGLGDVAVPSAWTGNNGKTVMAVNPLALALARKIAAAASEQLSTSAAINDGPCECQGIVASLEVVPIFRTPRVVVGGYGITYGGQSLTCEADGGMLEGCNPCPPSTGHSPLSIDLGLQPLVSAKSPRQVSLLASEGALVPNAHALLADKSPPRPTAAGSTTSGTGYIADDEQTTGAELAANYFKVPFIAFRGISDTTAVGNLWPLEYLVYQQLAANNSATAARLWIDAWSAS